MANVSAAELGLSPKDLGIAPKGNTVKEASGKKGAKPEKPEEKRNWGPGVQEFMDHYKDKDPKKPHPIDEARDAVEVYRSRIDENPHKENLQVTRVTIEPPRPSETGGKETPENRLIKEAKNLFQNLKAFEFSSSALSYLRETIKQQPEMGLFIVAAGLGSLSFIEQSQFNYLLDNIPITPAIASKLATILGFASMGASRGETMGGKIVGALGGAAAGAGFTEISNQMTNLSGTSLDPRVEASFGFADDAAVVAQIAQKVIGTTVSRKK